MIRTAIIGYGKVAHLHAKAIQGSKLAQLCAVYGRNKNKAGIFSDSYGIQAYADLVEMLETEKIDAVIICTPHPVHAESAIIAAEHAVHVLVEKPMAISLSDCDAMIAAAEKTNVKLGVISQRRFFAVAREVSNAIDAGKIGKPILGTVSMFGWRSQAYYESDPWRGTWDGEGGGVLVNQAPHQFDLLLWYMGEIAELTGFWSNLNHPYIEVEDTALAVIRFKNGALGNIVVSNSQNPGLHGKVHVHGENGLSVGVQTESGSMFIAGMSEIESPPFIDLWTIPDEADFPATCLSNDERLFEQVDPTVHYLGLQIQDFMEAILNDRQPLVTGYDGRAVVELFTGIYLSGKEKRTIQFPIPS